MNFRVTGLPIAPFQHLFGMSTDALAAVGVRRYVVDKRTAYPDRVELRDAEIGEQVLLLNYTHQPADTPYRASHAIFVVEGASATYNRVNEIPDALRRRTLSLRVFDKDHYLIDAELADGNAADAVIENLFANPNIAYIHAHYAKHGCYAARIDRV